MLSHGLLDRAIHGLVLKVCMYLNRRPFKSKDLCLSVLFGRSQFVIRNMLVLVPRAEIDERLKGSTPWQTFICSTCNSNKITKT